MSLVTATIRPSGTSYRDDLLSHKVHTNPSEIIDELLKDNLGYLIYQEDTIKFLQQICGLSGSEADNIRRAIGRKQKDRLDAAMPSILEGYCSKSPKPRDEAEQEAKEFLQVIEDSASYQFGYNHSVAYCLLGYLCAYYRYYHPLEFLTSYLNNAANDGDIHTAQSAQLIHHITPKEVLMATILITHGVPTAGLECLQGHDIIMPAPLTAYSMEELMQLIPQADAVIAAGKQIGRAHV